MDYIFNDHHEKRQFNSQSFLRVRRTLDKGRAHVGTHYFKNRGLDIRISYSFDVTISNCIWSGRN